MRKLKNGQKVQTASKGNQLQVSVVGTVILTYEVVENGKKLERMSHLFPVYYIYSLSVRLLSLGTLLNDGFELRETNNQLNFRYCSRIQMQLNPHVKGNTLFWLRAWVLLLQMSWPSRLFLQ